LIGLYLAIGVSFGVWAEVNDGEGEHFTFGEWAKLALIWPMVMYFMFFGDIEIND
jgi:hypothetical protein